MQKILIKKLLIYLFFSCIAYADDDMLYYKLQEYLKNNHTLQNNLKSNSSKEYIQQEIDFIKSQLDTIYEDLNETKSYSYK